MRPAYRWTTTAALWLAYIERLDLAGVSLSDRELSPSGVF